MQTLKVIHYETIEEIIECFKKAMDINHTNFHTRDKRICLRQIKQVFDDMINKKIDETFDEEIDVHEEGLVTDGQLKHFSKEQLEMINKNGL